MAYEHDPGDITVQMTSDAAPPPNVTSASSYTTVYGAWRAFDHIQGVNPSNWCTFSLPTPQAPQWLQFDFGAGITHVVNRYKGTNVGAWAGVDGLDTPRDWLFQGSNDPNIGWDTLDSREDIEWVIDETKEFAFSNSVDYRYYRLYITDYNPYAPYPLLLLGELELFEPIPAPPADRLVQYRRTRRPGPVAGI